MQWAHETVLITGATGFVGGNLAARLAAMAANVISIERDHKPNDTLSALSVRHLVTTVTGDVTDLALMQRVFAEYDVTYVFHLAAQALVGAAIREPVSTFETNIKGTWITLEAARVTSTLKGIIVASSDHVYGAHSMLPHTEDLPLLDRYPYGASKACTDILAQCYYTTYGLPLAITRNANTYGPGDLNFSRLVPAAIRCCLANETLELRGNGQMRRDYLYVDDAIDGYLALASGLGRSLNTGEIFNFGTTDAHSVLDVCSAICRLTGSTAKVRITDAPAREAASHRLDAKKARDRLEWSPRVPLELGLRRTIDWYREFLNAVDCPKGLASSRDLESGTKH